MTRRDRAVVLTDDRKLRSEFLYLLPQVGHNYCYVIPLQDVVEQGLEVLDRFTPVEVLFFHVREPGDEKVFERLEEIWEEPDKFEHVIVVLPPDPNSSILESAIEAGAETCLSEDFEQANLETVLREIGLMSS